MMDDPDIYITTIVSFLYIYIQSILLDFNIKHGYTRLEHTTLADPDIVGGHYMVLVSNICINLEFIVIFGDVAHLLGFLKHLVYDVVYY